VYYFEASRERTTDVITISTRKNLLTKIPIYKTGFFSSFLMAFGLDYLVRAIICCESSRCSDRLSGIVSRQLHSELRDGSDLAI
jgi:hypothetical protein